MKRFIQLLVIYCGIFLLFTGIFLALFHSPFKASDVFFYRGLIYVTGLFTIFVIVTVLLFIFRKLKNPETLIAASCIAASVNLSAFIVFPVTFDRSITMYMLDTLDKENTATCRGLSKESLQASLIDTYIIAGDALEKRLREQREISMIEQHNGCYVTTARAGLFLRFANSIGRLYNIRTSY